MNIVKNQHFVPRFYLSSFANESDKVYCLDKSSGKIFNTSVANIASESYFYDLDGNHLNQECENFLAKIEGAFAPLLAELLNGLMEGSITSLSSSLKCEICKYMCYQIIRTKEFREELIQIFTLLSKSLVDKEWFSTLESKHCEILTSEEDVKKIQIDFLMGKDTLGLIGQLSAVLDSHICILFKNVTAIPNYSSDHPVIKIPHLSSPVKSMNGYQSEGIEVVFPLSSTYLLGLYERTQFTAYEKSDHQIWILDDPSHILHFNSLQVMNSYRQVYCCIDNFEQAKDILMDQPLFGDSSRKRIETG